MPISDLFIAKRIQRDEIQYQLYDAFKLNNGYDIEVIENGMITALDSCDELQVIKANFSAARRQNLKGVIVNCGLVVSSAGNHDFIVNLHIYLMTISMSKIAYPEKFSNVNDPADSNADVFTKASMILGQNLLEMLNIRSECLFCCLRDICWFHNFHDRIVATCTRRKAMDGRKLDVRTVQLTYFKRRKFK